jgi:membrane associated rhomboid family serine protease
MFSCPHCRQRLVRTRITHGFVFVCNGCRGQGIALAVVRRAVPPEICRTLWRQAISGDTQRGAKCPACEQRMREVTSTVGDNAEIRLDLCTHCQFLWFDADEFEQLPHQLPIEEEQPRQLSPQAREAIAIAQVAHLSEQQRGEDFGGDAPDDAWKWIPAILGLPVEHEGSPTETLPWVTWTLAAVLIAITACTYHNLQAVADQFGLVPADPWRHGGVTWITNFFLHAGAMHVLGNVYFLLIFGDNVEDYLGRARYVILLTLAWIVGDIAHVVGQIHSEVPCIGASGGISGIIVFYALQFPRARLGIIIRYFYLFKWIYFPAYVGLLFWIALQAFTAYLQVSQLTNVSALAHLGGAATGLFAWLVWRNRCPTETPNFFHAIRER